MRNSLYVALSAQVALEKRLGTVAHNIANVNTPGFRATGINFAEEVARAGAADLAYVSSGSEFISTRTGPLTHTGNALDVAIQGDAWFGIGGKDGPVYTRDGRMRVSETGALESLTGAAILDVGGAPILVEAGGGPLSIAADGMITQGSRQVGAIGLFSIDKSAALSRAANSGVIPNREATAVLDFTKNKVVQGAVEGSNADTIGEMVQMIKISRTFESVAAEVGKTESSMQDALKTLAG